MKKYDKKTFRYQWCVKIWPPEILVVQDSWTERNLKVLLTFTTQIMSMMYLDWGLLPRDEGFNKCQISLSPLALYK